MSYHLVLIWIFAAVSGAFNKTRRIFAKTLMYYAKAMGRGGCLGQCGAFHSELGWNWGSVGELGET